MTEPTSQDGPTSSGLHQLRRQLHVATLQLAVARATAAPDDTRLQTALSKVESALGSAAEICATLEEPS